MRQVPRFKRFLLIGGGRAARHFAEYFRLEGLEAIHWTRASGTQALQDAALLSTHAVLAISDRAIEPFLREHASSLAALSVVHLSGSLATGLAPGAHPLMTFGENLYGLEEYRSIPFALERGRGGLDELLPGLRNPSFELDPGDKALYHAWCAMSGNFTAILWSAFFERLESRFGAPAGAALPYLRRQCANLELNGARALTGPLARGDWETVERHLQALKSDPFLEVYRGFVAAFRSQQNPDGSSK